jgi:excisionase family DNA binding protein
MKKPQRTRTIEIPVEEEPRLPPLAVSPEEAAELIHVGRTVFYELINAGKIKWVCIGKRKHIVAVKELERFLADEAVAGTDLPLAS